MNSYAVIDFETTGLSPAHGARPTEIAVVLVSGGEIVDRYQSLMNPGVPIPPDIQAFTGISNADGAQSTFNYGGDDRGGGFLPAADRSLRTMQRSTGNSGKRAPPGLARDPATGSSARCCWPGACSRPHPTTKLATLVRTLCLPSTGRFHRALADAECTAHLFIRLQQEIAQVFDVQDFDCGLLLKMQATNRHQLHGVCSGN